MFGSFFIFSLPLVPAGHDRSTLDLPENQYELITQLRAATKLPLIVVLIHGGTLALHSIPTQADGLLDAWYPGQMGAYGIVDVLFGDHNPAGR